MFHEHNAIRLLLIFGCKVRTIMLHNNVKGIKQVLHDNIRSWGQDGYRWVILIPT